MLYVGDDEEEEDEDDDGANAADGQMMVVTMMTLPMMAGMTTTTILVAVVAVVVVLLLLLVARGVVTTRVARTPVALVSVAGGGNGISDDNVDITIPFQPSSPASFLLRQSRATQHVSSVHSASSYRHPQPATN